MNKRDRPVSVSFLALGCAVLLSALVLTGLLLGLCGGRSRAGAAVGFWAVCSGGMADGCDFPTIQEAIDAAAEGDVIRVVGNAVYTENLVITKSLTLLGGCSTATCTVRLPGVWITTIDGHEAGRVATVYGDGRIITATLDGFVITGGEATSEAQHPYCGGGVAAWDVDLRLVRNVITGNVGVRAGVTGRGGGVYVLSGTVTLSHNQVLSNVAGATYSGQGGGICLENSAGLVADNLIRGNHASWGSTGTSDDGGGMAVYGCDPLTITDNVFYSNTATLAGNGYGGGIHVEDSVVTLAGNILRENLASRDGIGRAGGVNIQSSRAALSHNWILSNTATIHGESYGGGIVLLDDEVTMDSDTVLANVGTMSPTATLELGSGIDVMWDVTLTATNIVVARNTSANYPEGILFFSTPITVVLVNSTVADNAGTGISCGSFSGITLVNVIVWGNGNDLLNCDTAHLAYSDVEDGDSAGVLGNISQDPLFVDAARDDYHLQAASPCIDRGASPISYTLVPGHDWDDQGRPAGSGYDMGADEVWLDVFLPLVLRNY